MHEKQAVFFTATAGIFYFPAVETPGTGWRATHYVSRIKGVMTLERGDLEFEDLRF